MTGQKFAKHSAFYPLPPGLPFLPPCRPSFRVVRVFPPPGPWPPGSRHTEEKFYVNIGTALYLRVPDDLERRKNSVVRRIRSGEELPPGIMLVSVPYFRAPSRTRGHAIESTIRGVNLHAFFFPLQSRRRLNSHRTLARVLSSRRSVHFSNSPHFQSTNTNRAWLSTEDREEAPSRWRYFCINRQLIVGRINNEMHTVDWTFPPKFGLTGVVKMIKLFDYEISARIMTRRARDYYTASLRGIYAISTSSFQSNAQRCGVLRR